jgi:hypothetical protein
VFQFERGVLLVAVGAFAPPLFEDVLSDFVTGERPLLVFDARDFRVFEQLSIEFGEFDNDAGDWREFPTNPERYRFYLAEQSFRTSRGWNWRSIPTSVFFPVCDAAGPWSLGLGWTTSLIFLRLENKPSH